ncbi:MAG: GNAT family N-acetyltransferase [Acidimicrobiales bacterium]|nr:GNAT family N-acetyltransferase [Acidimicrobiales bacterium]
MALERHPVRIAAAGDADELASLLHDFNAEFDTPSPGVDVLASRLRRLLAVDGAVGGRTVAIVAGDPAVGVALVTFRPNVWFEGEVALLDELYVVPGLRSRGLGGAMIARLLELAEERGAGLIEINVDEADIDAQRFYERHGFTGFEPVTGDRAFYYQREL